MHRVVSLRLNPPNPSKIVEEYLNDPDIYQGNVKARTGNEILKVGVEHSA